MVSAAHVELVATDTGVRLRDLGSRNGTVLGGHRVALAYLTAGASFTCGDTTLVFTPTKPEDIPLSRKSSFGRLVGSSPPMRRLFEHLRVLSKTELTVLILGETGTGKELVARAIHEASPRSEGPFVVVDCGAIPASLAESTLFGHERGAFTGAVTNRVSPFVEAHGGTLFLDELGELPLELQPKLLRVLAERRVRSIGGKSDAIIDVRVSVRHDETSSQKSAMRPFEATSTFASRRPSSSSHRCVTAAMTSPRLRSACSKSWGRPTPSPG